MVNKIPIQKIPERDPLGNNNKIYIPKQPQNTQPSGEIGVRVRSNLKGKEERKSRGAIRFRSREGESAGVRKYRILVS